MHQCVWTVHWELKIKIFGLKHLDSQKQMINTQILLWMIKELHAPERANISLQVEEI